MKLDQKSIDYLMTLKPDDVTKNLLMDFFAYKGDNPPRFSPNDTFILPINKVMNKEPISTTIGRYIFNLFIIFPVFLPFIGYQNVTVTKKYIGELEGQLSELLLNKKITPQDFIDYLNRIQWLGFTNNDFLCPSISMNFIKPNEKVMKKKKELVEKYKKEISDGDPVISTKMEKELLEIARKELKNDPTMDLYDSGAKASFDNNYKCTNVMKGAIKDTSTGLYNISTSNYIEGINKEEYAAYADMIVNAAYSRAIETKSGGYETKKMFAAFQTVSLDKDGSDCLTKKTLTFIMNEKNYKLFLYRYIAEGNKLIQLDNNNIKNYIGKVIHLRSALFCQSEKLCSKCAGELYYKLGIKNIGLTTAKLSSSLLNLSMKVFHDTTLDLYKINYLDFIE